MLRIFAGHLGRSVRRVSGQRFFLFRRCGRFVVRLYRNLVREFVFERCQLPAVLEHFPQQAALGLDGLPLLHHQQGQNPVRNQKQNNQQRKQRAPRLWLRICSLRGIDNSQGAPKLPGPLGCPVKCTCQSICKVECNCLVGMELSERHKVHARSRVQASALYE